ncbi:hypothetical protein ACRN9G_17610 [Shewanella frigidimarina]|uniref:hypothetical protein n=1 Tax=Shewanella frigidimarina TaxID=56812 RepID=UPI003D7A77C4
MSDIIKNASKHLQEIFKSNHNVIIGSSHAHAAISGYLGYKSKKALLADHYDEPIEDEFVLFNYSSLVSLPQLEETILRMKDSPLKKMPTHQITNAIEEALTPGCECCGHKTIRSQPLFSNDDIDNPIAQVCSSCIRNEEGYATCHYCGDEILYRTDDLNSAGECSEHRGEGSYSDEEREDWESYVENVTNNF